MVQTNKILTVSYGTFSCTLEGFDDAFGTMKAIAEYFRDLAADDRYFGAEPPQPDADMLARIAQREIARRVEAHEENAGIVLRATDDSARALVAAPAAQPPAPVAEEQPVEEPVEAQPEVAVETAEQAPVEIATEELAPEAEEIAETEVVDEVPEVAEVPEDAAEIVEAEEVLPEAPSEAVAASSVAEKLARIRAVVARNEASAGEEAAAEDTTEPEPAEIERVSSVPEAVEDALAEDHAEDVVVEDQPEDIQAADLIAEDQAEEIVAGDQTPEDVAEDLPLDTIVADVAESEMTADGAEDTPEDDINLFEDLSDSQDDADDALSLAGENLMDDTADDLAEDLDVLDELEDLAGEDKAGMDDDILDSLLQEAADAAVAEAVPMAEPEAAIEDVAAPAQAELVKVKREDLEAAQVAAELPTEEPEFEAASSLSPEDEDDLMRELAQVEAELADTDTEEQAPIDDGMPRDELEAMAERTPTNRRVTAAMADDDLDISRLMEEAGTKMEDPESSSRREAYSHLRAAVAATKAELSMTSAPQAIEDQTDYRDDLANVVRPRRPEGGSPRRPRPGEARPAPLKLVAEQRVDTPQRADSGSPVRPRRVLTDADFDDPKGKDEAQAPGKGSFANYAKEVGATELAELLEAGAAYMSFVEGREQFSRPQLMTKVRHLEDLDFNREDGLRAFGQLLREGKIEKKGGGRFTASEQIGFRPERKAG